MRIGVLALQGDFQEHEQMLGRLGVETVEVRRPEQLEGLDALVIPGGESTTIGKLAATYGLVQPLKELAKSMPMWGTCGGLVFMAREVGFDQPTLGILDIVVERNAFGRQVDSFEEDVDFDRIGLPAFHGVFIRAPVIKEVGPSLEILCRVQDGRIVAVRNGHLMATAFHPELTGDDRLHRYFLDIVSEKIAET